MDPAIISTGGIMNKLEGCYLLVLVNTEITEGAITKRVYNSYFFQLNLFQDFISQKQTNKQMY